jgi:uncharacterized protein (DUF433 family)
MFYSDSDVMKRKPIRQKGQDIRTLPTYTIPEAAAFLAMPTRTLQAWYSGKNPLLVATGQVGSIALLSFRDLEEAYKVHVLRSKYAFSFPKLREALVVAREESHRDHPLLESEFSAFRGGLVIHLPARGRRRKQVLQLMGPRQLAVPEVVDVWGRRIVAGGPIFPWRYLADDDESRPVSLDPEVMSGRLVVAGTRVPVQVLWRRSLAGQSPSELAEDYDLSEELVTKALMHIDVHKKAA